MKHEQFEGLRDSSIGHSLIKAGRLYNEFAFNTIKKSMGAINLRPSHLQLFAYIPFEGITIVALAKRANISKQAVSVMVRDLLKEKILIKSSNPVDKRSFIIQFNENKKTGIFKGMKMLKKLDQELIGLLGESASTDLHHSLRRIIDKYNF
jgi:DNA-binding MarR family transcriptional regulator